MLKPKFSLLMPHLDDSHSPLMKRLIRNRATREYLTADGQWGDFQFAKDFADAQSALITCRGCGITETVEMVLTIGEAPCSGVDVAISLAAKR